MPSDVLLPLFALTLLANAVLVGVAIRGMRRGSEGSRGPGPSIPEPRRADPPATVSRDTGAGDAEPSPAAGIPSEPVSRGAMAPEPSPAGASPPGPSLAGATPPEPSPAGGVAGPDGSDPMSEALPPSAGVRDRDEAVRPARDGSNLGSAASRRPVAVRRPAVRPPAPGAARGLAATAAPPPTAPETGASHTGRPAAAAPSGTAPAAATPPGSGRRGRRRFALPPLDEDHEKVSRSIETFLGGGDEAPADAAAGEPPAGPGATTVAIVAIDGLPAPRRRPKRPSGAAEPAGTSPASAEAAVDAVAMVERTLRGAARGSDVVSVDRAGRFRVVLPGTGELAARAYLRRVRATVEPILEASEDPLRLVVATATVLGRPVDDAIRAADRRMAAALRTVRAGIAATATTEAPTDVPPPAADEDIADPRAAGD